MTQKTFANLLKIGRAKAGLTQAQAAAKLDVNPMHLSSMERGVTTDPGLRVIAAVVKVYGVCPHAVIECAER